MQRKPHKQKYLKTARKFGGFYKVAAEFTRKKKKTERSKKISSEKNKAKRLNENNKFLLNSKIINRKVAAE